MTGKADIAAKTAIADIAEKAHIVDKTDKTSNGQGCLYLCGTPIGNLEDITLRVLRILKEADCIAAEDTRHTLKLLNYFEIAKPLISYHEHNKRERGPKIISMVQEGQQVAVVSDAGMPGISDPGADLVILARQSGVPVTVVPGPSAALSALVLSGLPTETFVFEGFLPREKKLRRQRLDQLKGEQRTIILYEAPHQLRKLLQDLLETLGDRRIALARELTKLHEEVIPLSLEEAVAYYREVTPRGEFVLVMEGVSETLLQEDYSSISIEDHLLRYIMSGLDKREAVKQVAKDRNIPKSQVYPYSIGLDRSE